MEHATNPDHKLFRKIRAIPRWKNVRVFWMYLIWLSATLAAGQNLNITKSMSTTNLYNGEAVTCCLTVTASGSPEADICWVLDITGSMGAEITYLESDLSTFTSQLAASGIDYQNGLVAFRDVSECNSIGNPLYPDMATFPLTPNNSAFLGYVSSQIIGGGGDVPESSLEGLQAAVFPTDYCGDPTVPMAWRPGASHTLILITDAGFHASDYDGLSSLSSSFPVSLYNLGYNIDVISNDCSNPTYQAYCTNAFTCTTCNPAAIPPEAGGVFQQLTRSASDWSGFLSALATKVGSLTNVVIQDPLPPQLVPVSSGSAGESIAGNTVYFTIPSISLSGTPTPIEYCFPVTVSATSSGSVSNTAYISANGVSQITSNTVIGVIEPDTFTPTQTPTNTPTLTPTGTNSPTITFTPTRTPTPTSTFTPTPTHTPTCETHVWPDPYNPKWAVRGWLKVDCLPSGAVVSFYTVSGEWVQKVHESEGLALWDGRNRFGIAVSPGIYFYVVEMGSNVLKRGKFLVAK